MNTLLSFLIAGSCSCSLLVTRSFEDKEVQRDKKLMSYDIIDKQGKPMVQVEVGGQNKVRVRGRIRATRANQRQAGGSG